jgi:ribonuclease HI
MELTAVIAALSSLPAGVEAVVLSDSPYVVKCFTEGRRENWERRGWKTDKGTPVANLDLWHQVFALERERDVTFEPVEAHSGHHWNELADKLAVEMSRR